MLIFIKCACILMENMQISILFVYSVMGAQQKLSKNMRDDSYIWEHLVGECFHACTGIYKK